MAVSPDHGASNKWPGPVHFGVRGKVGTRDGMETCCLQAGLDRSGCGITKYSSSHSFNPLLLSKSAANLSVQKVKRIALCCVSLTCFHSPPTCSSSISSLKCPCVPANSAHTCFPHPYEPCMIQKLPVITLSHTYDFRILHRRGRTYKSKL